MDKGFSSRGGEAVSDFGDVAEMEIGSLDCGVHMGIKGEGGVQDKDLSLPPEGEMVELSMVSEMGPVLLRVDLVPMRRCSVLSLLSLRKFCVVLCSSM